MLKNKISKEEAGVNGENRNQAEEFKEILSCSVADPVEAAAGSRRAVITFHDAVAPGIVDNPALPVSLSWYCLLRVIGVGPAPEKDRKAVVLLGTDLPIPEGSQIFLNGQLLELAPELPDDCAVPLGVDTLTAYQAVNKVKAGDNIIEILPAGAEKVPNLLWCEINIAPLHE